jgi:hypothetical protein
MLALFVGLAPGAMAAFCMTPAAHAQCCPGSCDMPAAPSHPMAPASCCNVSNPAELETGLTSQTSEQKNSRAIQWADFALTPRPTLKALPQGISSPNASPRMNRGATDLPAILCTFLI